MHGDADEYFPVAHAAAIYDSARDPRDLWIIPGMGHAERAVSPDLVDRLREWLVERLPQRERPQQQGTGATGRSRGHVDR